MIESGGGRPSGGWLDALEADAATAGASLRLALYALILLQIGSMFPDIDQRLPFVPHRSALTHSALVPALLAIRLPAIGGLLAGGVAIHLVADLLPEGWAGYALVKVPFLGPLGPDASWWFLLLNGLFALALFLRTLGSDPAARSRRLLLGSFLAATAIVYFLFNEGYWPVLALVAVAGLVLWRLVKRQ